MNPLFEEWNKALGPVYNSHKRRYPSVSAADVWALREKLVIEYSWAIPDANIISFLAKQGPLIEIGAGTGYWAKLIQNAGGDILPFDATPPHYKRPNPYRHSWTYTKIRCGTEKILLKYVMSPVGGGCCGAV